MVPLLVFYVHLVAMAAAFTKRWQDEGLSEGFLAVFFMGLIFFVGWSMTSFITKLIMPPQGFGLFFDRDAASLLLLTFLEVIFYTFYLRSDEPKPTDEHA
ncbi:MAG: hypothetical protein WB699_09190 [Bacteroidota bacterium]